MAAAERFGALTLPSVDSCGSLMHLPTTESSTSGAFLFSAPTLRRMSLFLQVLDRFARLLRLGLPPFRPILLHSGGNLLPGCSRHASSAFSSRRTDSASPSLCRQFRESAFQCDHFRSKFVQGRCSSRESKFSDAFHAQTTPGCSRHCACLLKDDQNQDSPQLSRLY